MVADDDFEKELQRKTRQKVLSLLRDLQYQYPGQRIGQIIFNAVYQRNKAPSLFYVEDHKLALLLEEYGRQS